jgi:lysozyme
MCRRSIRRSVVDPPRSGRSVGHAALLAVALIALGPALLGCSAELDSGVASAGGPADPADDKLGTVSDPLVVCAAGETVKGIDVSYYQGNVNWQKVKAAGRLFAFARVNHGDFIDPEFKDNWARMKANGIIRGAYQYFDPHMGALAQAQILIDRVGTLGPGDLPAVLDVEEAGGVSPSKMTDKISKWTNAVQAATGKKPIIYTAKYFWQAKVGSGKFDDHPLWTAHWDTKCPDLPNSWNDWVFWQHSDSGKVDGIGGRVDLNRFNGSRAELEAFAGKVYEAEALSLPSPIVMEAGQRLDVTIALHNAGTKSWNDSTALGTTQPRDRASVFADGSWLDEARVTRVDDKVAPGEDHSFVITLHAPTEPGVYVEHFNLVHDDRGWFSDEPQQGPPDDAIALTIEVQALADDGAVDPEPEPGEVDPVAPSTPPVAHADAEAGCSYSATSPATGSPFAALVVILVLGGALTRRRHSVVGALAGAPAAASDAPASPPAGSSAAPSAAVAEPSFLPRAQ